MGEKRLELRLGINGLRYRIAGNSDIPLNQWVHVAATYDGNTARLYINGQPDRIYTEVSGPIQQNDKPVYIGGSQFYNRYFDGVIDEVHIYNNALSAEEILSLFDGTSEPLAFAPIGDKEVNEASTLTFEVNVLMPDVEVFVSEHDLPSEPNFSQNVFNWTPTYDNAGSYEATFAASRGMIEDFETITIAVNNVNRKPVIEPVSNQTVDENTLLSFTVNATDPDGDALTYLADNIPVGATFISQSFDWTPGYEQAGLYVLNFGASDGDLQDVDSAIITVINNNRPPLLQPIGDKSITENEPLSITIVADDDDNDLITYSAQNLPTGASFSGDTFIWTPGFGQAGTYQVIITASDGWLQDSETITITVVGSTPAPDGLVGCWKLDDGIGSIAADSSGSGNTGILFNGPAWTAGIVDGGLIFDGINDYINCGNDLSLNVTGSLTIAAWINPKSFGERGWGRIVDKGNGAAGYSLFLEEATASIAYVIYGQYIARSNYNVVRLNQWQHVTVVYDAESSLLSFYIDGQAAGTVSYGSDPVSAGDSPLTIGIRGYDLKRAFDGKIDEVRVYNYALSRSEIADLANPILNCAPIFDSIGDKTVVENEGLMFSISATDADGDAITYSAGNLPVGAVFTGDTFNWVPATGQAGTYQVTFTASDDELQDMEIITITVSPPPPSVGDLVGRWKFDEGTGVITEDTSGRGNIGSLVNGAVWTTGVTGKAIGFDGIDDYVDCGTDESLNITGSLTIAAWINLRSYGQNGWGRIVDKGNNRAGYSFFLEETTGAIAYVVYGGLIARSNHNLIMRNRWRHVAVVYDKSAGLVTFYVNGRHAGTEAYSSSPSNSAGSPLVIGIRGYDFKRAFDGVIDQVQVYNCALSQEQIAQLP
jgi:PKD repeat protein